MTGQTPAEMLARLTDAEKVSLTAGADAWTTRAVDRVGVPAVRVGDGPHGVRRPQEGSALSMFDSHPATCFPTASALGSSWDPALVREVGEALGKEAAGHGIGVLLGPGVNLKRTPVGGRNFEYFSEDPHLSSRIGAAWVGGVQSTGVGASLKHFAANNTEQRRYGIEAVVDERALRELYLASFEHIVVTERPATVMAAYNRLNGPHCTENAWLLNGVLRGEWGFEGVVVSDWGAAWDRTASVPAGNDLAMPGLGRRDDRYVQRALTSGRLPQAALDASVLRILELAARYGHAPDDGEVDLEAHHDLARRAAAAGTVLLKNDGVLPIAAGSRVAVIGAMGEEPRYQGAGSSHVVPTQVDTLLQALTEALGDSAVSYAPGYDRGHDRATPAQLAQARVTALAADVAVVVVGLPETFETEGVDREHLRLPASHDELVETVRAANPRTIVVLQNGSPVELPWAASVPAIVEGYLGGQASGSAMADVLLGAVEPGGRLAETFPVHYDDHPVAVLPNGPATIEYRESLYVGYRWFDSAGEAVAFPFGHGLSYTSFSWSEAAVTVGEGLDEVEVRLTVTNTGSRSGSEVVQVYVHDPESTLFRPEQELRAFEKVVLDPGESAEVVLRLDRRAFSAWDAAVHAWVLEPGEFQVRLGRSSRDIVRRATVQLGGAGELGAAGEPGGARDDREPPAHRDPLPYREPSRAIGFPATAFGALLGRTRPGNRAARQGRFTLDTSIRDMQEARVGRLLLRFATSRAIATLGAPAGAAADAVAGDVVSQFTFRMIPTVSGGIVGRRAARRLLGIVNLLARLDRSF
ncbi:glycoside hydrolase family 3 C-terminal domain-containing protein [Herbiconiux sp.]|uniref:glycoside hydrolase family 3 C-terminal domain-containing protein n=1 Tax=Herbiconiux sp. TaxID=1871186 RepID=UPI0025C5892D|nr:glycoside hydrolase family 3 C-terminal domain-containing protein [Herbiconiux sp.]